MSGSLRIRFLEAGYTKHIEALWLKGGRLKTTRFPATVAVIEHPTQGVILFDTGYSERFFEQTKYFPNKFYSLITPVTIDSKHTAAAQLRELGISVEDVRWVILSHFHADHIGGVGDFPKATFVYRKSAYEAVRSLGSWGAVKAGFLRGLLPAFFEAQSRPLSDEDFNTDLKDLPGFSKACDLFKDQSVILVDLPGHACGQMGLYIKDENHKAYFLVADACWGKEAFEELRPPPAVARFIFSDSKKYFETLNKLHRLSIQSQNLEIVPCHCDQTFKEVEKLNAVS